MDQLEGKVAVITGAASGIGFCTATLLAQQGMKVVLADVNGAMLDESVGKLRSQGFEATGVVTDVSSLDAMENLANAAYETYGKVNLLFLNAGISSQASLFNKETEDWRRIVDVNYFGVVWGIKAFADRMVESGEEGLILATTSGAALEGTTYQSSAYSSTKNAVVTLMECLYGQLRDKDCKVTAGLAVPPLADTHLNGPDPGMMKMVEGYLHSLGVPTVLSQPEQVAAMILDGIVNDRFFIRVNEATSQSCYDGNITPEILAWKDKMMRGRAEAQINDTKPDDYIW